MKLQSYDVVSMLVELATKKSPGVLMNGPQQGLHVGLGESVKNNSRGWTGDDVEYRTLCMPDWVFPDDPIPYSADSVSVFHAYHFLEHLPGPAAVALIEQIWRCLHKGGIFNFGVPYAGSVISHADLDHKSFWNERTFPLLLGRDKDKYDWQTPGLSDYARKGLQINYQLIIGHESPNLMLIGQLEKIQ